MKEGVIWFADIPQRDHPAVSGIIPQATRQGLVWDCGISPGITSGPAVSGGVSNPFFSAKYEEKRPTRLPRYR